jgi:hypothetical protein
MMLRLLITTNQLIGLLVLKTRTCRRLVLYSYRTEIYTKFISFHMELPHMSVTCPEQNQGRKYKRIHYSGPLMPPGGNIEDMLKEHERHIQEAVRKARLGKGNR